MIYKSIFLLAYVSVCNAHVCMLSPPQRTALNDINKAGSDSCIMLDPPCGKTKPNVNKLFLFAGQNFTVVFQKNLDHYNPANPGYWSVSIGQEMDTLKELYHITDSATPSLTIYSANITIPERFGKNMIIQTQYVPKNPQAPPNFYQCADIVVL